MTDFVSEVMRALPNLPEETLNQLMMKLHGLGVETSQDMKWVEEHDLTGILKVIQCRKLINHFKVSVGQEQNSWVQSPQASNKSLQEHQPYSQMNTACNSTMPAYVSPYKDLSRHVGNGHTSFAPSNARGSCVHPQTRSPLPVQNGSVMSDASFPAFTMSPPFSITKPSSTPEEHGSVVTSTDSYAPLPLECEVQEATQTMMGRSSESASSFQATTSMRPNDASTDYSFCGRPSLSSETSLQNTSKLKRRSGFNFSEYKLPLHKLPDEIRGFLEDGVEIEKPYIHELVRVIVNDLLEEKSLLTASEIASVTKAVISAYPTSLGNVTCGKNSQPGFESLEKIIHNRFVAIKYNRVSAIAKRPACRLKGVDNSRTW